MVYKKRNKNLQVQGVSEKLNKSKMVGKVVWVQQVEQAGKLGNLKF